MDEASRRTMMREDNDARQVFQPSSIFGGQCMCSQAKARVSVILFDLLA